MEDFNGKIYNINEVIGMLINLGLEPDGITEYPKISEFGEYEKVSCLEMKISLPSLLNIFANESKDMKEIRRVSRILDNNNSMPKSVNLQYSTIKFEYPKTTFSSEDVLELISELDNGKNINKGYVTYFPNAIVDKHMHEYRNCMLWVNILNPIEQVNSAIKANMYCRKDEQYMEQQARLKGEIFALNRKLQVVDNICNLTKKLNRTEITNMVCKPHSAKALNSNKAEIEKVIQAGNNEINNVAGNEKKSILLTNTYPRSKTTNTKVQKYIKEINNINKIVK